MQGVVGVTNAFKVTQIVGALSCRSMLHAVAEKFPLFTSTHMSYPIYINRHTYCVSHRIVVLGYLGGEGRPDAVGVGKYM